MKTLYPSALVTGPLMHVSVLVPEPPVIVVADRLQERFPWGGCGMIVKTLSVTVPVNPMTGERVIVEDPGELAMTGTDERADVNVQDSVELPDPPVTVVGVRVHALLSETSATSPVNPFRGDTAIVDVPADPTTTVTLEGVAVIEKSAARVAVYATLAECDREPLVPVTVT